MLNSLSQNTWVFRIILLFGLQVFTCMQTLGLVVHSQVQSIMWIVDALGQERVKQLQPPELAAQTLLMIYG